MKLEHRFQAFRTLEDAKGFHKGILLTPKSRGEHRYEYQVIGTYVDLDEYPYVRSWNEWVEE
jgi:hypothetical protein